MGLDMYLYKRKYVKNWEHTPEEDRHTVTVEHKGKVLTQWDNPIYITKEVAYWRKFNALHGFIVEHFNNGKDDCSPIPLNLEDLKTIHNQLVKTIKENNPELLPPTSGFFFGNTEVDDYYWSDISDAINTFVEIINMEDKDVIYEYHASW
jgi:hypothetical protein